MKLNLKSWTWLALTAAALGAGCGDDAGAGGGAGSGGSGGAGGVGGAGGEGGASDGGGGASDGGGGTSDGGGGGQVATPPCEPPDPALADRDADELYAADEVPRFDFHLPEERWADLKKNARDEEYVEAEACYKGKSLGVVGLRFKGGYGTLQLCFDAQGNLTCPKLSMKVKFDEYVDGQRFYTQRRLNFHSMVWDPTRLHERIAYGLYREMGVAAPRSAWATLHVNGESQGLFSMVEEVDGRFLEDHFPDGPDGDLYKEAWPRSSDASTYADHIETNEQEATHERIAAFAADLASAEGAEGAEGLAALSTWADVGHLQRYMAVDEAIANWDGVTTFYVSPEGDAYNHNFYLYDEPSSGKFHLIPWDMDQTLGPSTYFGQVPRWNEAPAACPVEVPVFMGAERVMVPGCDPLFRALSQDPEGYLAALQELLDGPFSEGRIEAQVDEHAALIRAAVAEDPAGPGLDAWESSVERLRNELPILRERLGRFASNTPLVPFSFTAAGINDFEAADTLELYVGTLLATNNASGAVQGLDQEDPLSGAQSLLLRFDFRDEAYAWGHYVYFTVPLAEGQVDATPLEGVRFRARADGARTLRFDVESPAQSEGISGIRYGWDVRLGAEPQLVELRFADIALPDWAIDEGRDPGDDVNDVLRSIIGLAFGPQVKGVDGRGFLRGAVDSGFVEIDDVELFGPTSDTP
ncbi:CotH kinase family protein [Sorangium sp. So ce131]|uniref:CotH kinase family protein n=1 Tax=Sorangium sp. So ce131 TaxID=3133282 RepID=UPI003F5FA3D3